MFRGIALSTGRFLVTHQAAHRGSRRLIARFVTPARLQAVSRNLICLSSCSKQSSVVAFPTQLQPTFHQTRTMADAAAPALPGLVPLAEHDPDLFAILQKEKQRQREGLELIASENFTSLAVNQCLGSCLTNKYSEGLPGARYYGGNDYIDQVEDLCRTRALAAFHLDAEQWGVNVQPYSGSPANFAAYTGVLAPHSRIMGLDLPSGGHLTHGYYSYNAKDGSTKPISATSVYFESLPYEVNMETGLIDYDGLAERVSVFKPKMIICGGSAYPRDWDYKRFRDIADTCNAILLCDMAHISGLVATQEANNPFEYCDIVTTTTHKSLRGPRAGMIFFRKDARGFEAKINFAVFPMLQGGPHEHQIAAIATQLKEVMSPAFKSYIQDVKANCHALAEALKAKGHKLATDGTDNHLLLWDLRPHGITGSKMEKICDAAHITLNKNAILGDRSALSPGAVRIGTPALTTRGFTAADFEKVAELLDQALAIAKEIQAEVGKPLKGFVAALDGDARVNKLREDVKAFAGTFPLPGGEF
eukprot:m.354705 g.354705  ORF g.354705 m.354705 type:complete len:532 (+) comp17084_c0_seq1:307-1902(+)